jgi:hypothetical protein
MPDPRAKETLQSLDDAIVRMVEEGISESTLTPIKQVYFRFRLEGDPRNTERGVDLPPARSETSTRHSWAYAISTVVQRQVQTREFQAAVAALKDGSERHAQAEEYLQRFVFAVARQTFELDPGPRREAFEYLIQRFLDDLEGLPFDMSAHIELDGFALQTEKLELTPEIMLRRPKREDFEKETPHYGPSLNSGISFDPTISAIATVKRRGTNPRDAQVAVEKLVAMLRLFEVGSVTYLSYHMAAH